MISLFKNRMVKNAGWMIAGKIVQMLIGFVVGLLTARYLGPGNYGLINYAGAYTTFFAAICTLGINSVIVKEFVDAPGREGEIIGTALGLRAISSMLSVLMILGISCILDAEEPITRIVVALCSVGVLFNIFETFNYWFQSRLEAKKTAIATLIAYTITSVYKIYLLWTQKSVIYFSIATSVDYICIAVVLFYFYKRDHAAKLSFSWTYGKKLLKKSYHFILPGLMVAIYGQTDKLMLKNMINQEEIGYYATAAAICNMWCFVLSAVIDSVIPTIMEKHNESRIQYERYNRLLYCLVFYISVCVSIFFTIFGGKIIWILYGEAYLPAVAPLRVITWYTAFSYLGVARNAWVVCENKQKYLKYIYLAAAISNVILNLLFIPKMGAVGAAIASLAAQIITVIIIPFFIRDMRENSIMMLEAIFFRGLK